MCQFTLLALPLDILCLIVDFSDAESIFGSLRRVNRSLGDICINERYWRRRWIDRVLSEVRSLSAQSVTSLCVFGIDSKLNPEKQVSVEVVFAPADLTADHRGARAQQQQQQQPTNDAAYDHDGLIVALASEVERLTCLRGLTFYERMASVAQRPRIRTGYSLRIFESDQFDPDDPPATFVQECLKTFLSSFTDCLQQCFSATSAERSLENDPSPAILFPIYDPLGDSGGAASAEHPIVAVNGTRLRPKYSTDVLRLYQFLLVNTFITDIKHQVWVEEEKTAVCSRIVSPSAKTVEFRWFYLELRGSFPKMYTRMVHCKSALPNDLMNDVFDDNPQMAYFFHGGYGRVEVDHRPNFFRNEFTEVMSLLGLPPDFPSELMWNVLVLASCGFHRLREHVHMMDLYYHTTIVDCFTEKILHA